MLNITLVVLVGSSGERRARTVRKSARRTDFVRPNDRVGGVGEIHKEPPLPPPPFVNFAHFSFFSPSPFHYFLLLPTPIYFIPPSPCLIRPLFRSVVFFAFSLLSSITARSLFFFFFFCVRPHTHPEHKCFRCELTKDQRRPLFECMIQYNITTNSIGNLYFFAYKHGTYTFVKGNNQNCIFILAVENKTHVHSDLWYSIKWIIS